MAFSPHEIDWTPEKSQRLWDRYAANPSIDRLRFGVQAGHQVAREIDRHIGFSNITALIDMSCGKGDILNACQAYPGTGGQTISGTEFSANNARTANKRLKNAPAFKGVEHITSFPSTQETGAFDLAISTEVIEHLNDEELDAMLAESRRLLRPGGHIFLTTPNDEDLAENEVMCPDCGCAFHRWQHVRSWNAATLARRLEQAGYETRVCQTIAWGSSYSGRIPRFLQSTVQTLLNRLRTPTGLIYVGRKR